MTPRRNVVKEYVPVYYDADTGAVINDLSPQEKQQADAEATTKFSKAFPALLDIAKLSLTMHKSTFALLIYVLTVMSFGNKFYYRRNVIAKELGLSPAAITVAFQELLKQDFCVAVGKDKLCLVNPRYAFRGVNPASTQSWYNKLTYESSTSHKSADQKQSATSQEQTPSQPAVSVQSALKSSEQYGLNKKIQIVKHLLSQRDESNCVNKQVNQLVEELGISKVTIIGVLKMLQSQGYIDRPSRGKIILLKADELDQMVNSRDEEMES